MWGEAQEIVTVQSYLTSAADLQSSKYRQPHGVTWSTEENAAYFSGGVWDATVTALPSLSIQDKPLKNVNTRTGFSISFEFKTFNEGTGYWARFFEAGDMDPTVTEGNPANAFAITSTGGTRGAASTAALDPLNDPEHMGVIFDRYDLGHTEGYVRQNHLVRSDKNISYWSDPNSTPGTQWHVANLVISPTGSPRLYIDGVLLEMETKPISGSLDGPDPALAMQKTLADISSYETTLIGRSCYYGANDGYYHGYMRNMQIVSSSSVDRLKLKESVNFGKILANSVPLNTVGTLAPLGGDIALTEQAEDGYHLDWSTVTYQSKYDTGPISVPSNHVFQMPDYETEIAGSFVQNQYIVNYVLNEAGATYSTTVSAGTKGHYSAFTVSSARPIKTQDNKKYELMGWTTESVKHLGDNETLAATDYAIGTTYAVDNAKSLAMNRDNHGDVKNLYPVWKEKTYTISVDPAMYGGTVTLKKEGDAGDGVTSLTAKYNDKIIISADPDETLNYSSIKYVTMRKGFGSTSRVAAQNGEYSVTVDDDDIQINAVFAGVWTIKLEQALDNSGQMWVGDIALKTEESDVIIGKTLAVKVSCAQNYMLDKFYYRVKPDGQTGYGNELEYTETGNISYSVSTGEYTIKMFDNTGKLSVRATFKQKSDLSTATGNDIPIVVIANDEQDQTWTGSTIVPNYELRMGSSTGELAPTNAFTVTFEDDDANEEGAINAGSAKAKITAKNSEAYKGSIEQTGVFTIKGDLAYAEVVISDLIYTGERITSDKLNVTATMSGNSHTLASVAGDLEVLGTTYPTSPAPTNAGDYTVTIKPSTAGSTKFKNSKADVNFSILPADLGTQLKDGFTVTGGTTGTQNVSASSTALTLPTISGLQLKGATGNMNDADYKIVYVSPDGTELQNNTVPANSFGKYYAAIVAKGANTAGYKLLTDVFVTFQKSENIANYTWATYYNNLYNLTKPTSHTVYQVMTVETNTVTIQEVGYIPRNVPVLLYNSSATNTGTTSITLDESEVLNLATNYTREFKGTATALDVSTLTGDVYILNGNQFVRTKSGTIPANRCYLLLNTTNNSRLRISAGGDDDNATGIVDALRDLQEGQWYDMNGRRLEGPQGKGVYIVNGRKVIIK